MEEEFEKTIKTILENPPEFPYQEARWKVLEQRLNQKSNAHTESGWWKNCWLFFFNKNSN